MFSSGFAETGAEGRALQVELTRRCAAGGMKLLGPNSLGMFNVHDGLYSTFSSYFDPLWPRTGPVSIVSQSGAFGTYFLAIAAERGLGFSHFVATGNEADVDVAACVEWLADDPATGVIMIYLEGCSNGARLRAALARAAANRKPVIAMKVGVSEQGVAAIASHTGSLAGSDAVFDAVFAENNVHRARSLDELVDVAYACSGGVFPKSPRLGVVTLSGGVGIQMADAAAELGLELPRMPDAAQQKVLAMVPFAGPANPVDTTAQVVNDWSMFTKILGIVADEGAVDSVVSFLAHMGTTPGLMDRLKPAFLEVRQRFPDRVFVLCARMPREMADAFTALGFLIFEDPNRAIAAVAALARLQAGYAKVRAPVAIGQGGTTTLPAGPINEAEAKRLLGAAGVPFAPERVARTREEAIAAATEIGFPVVLKVLSRRHRPQVGSGRRRARAAERRRRRHRLRHHDGAGTRARAERPPRGRAGRAHDRGRRRDRDRHQARSGVRPRGDVRARRRLCRGAEGRDLAARAGRPCDRARDDPRHQGLCAARRRARLPPVDLDALADAIIAMSRFGAAHDVASAEINPFIALPQGGFAVDALILTEGANRDDRSRATEGRDHRARAATGIRSTRASRSCARNSSAAYLDFQDGPAREGHLEPKVREFIYIAIDGAVSHLYERGLRRHIEDALRLGATKEEVLQVIMLATAAEGQIPNAVGHAILMEELGATAPTR